MRKLILLAVVLFAGCDISGPARNTAALERRIAELEEKLAAKGADDSAGFDRCMGDVEGHYWEYVKLNGGRTRQSPKGMVWRASTAVWNQAAADKRNAIELCKATWKRGD
jgi:hypothetical protein